ncbi:hypothetical protein [Photobacterium nomapromontoriensis]|uniref:hypothetical protein n=1 Tax=Photobacterium nomapromontoriensis TaxID=2910237 RepID=UPI003D09A213
MKLIKTSQLHFQEGNSDKVYEVDLVETTANTGHKYLVNFRYGRRGGNLREGTKTPTPISFDQAEKIFNSVIVAKCNKGYYSEDIAPVTDTVQSNASHTEQLLHRIKNEKYDHARSRQIWRLPPAPHPEAASLITGFLGSDIWRYDYSILWTLGRVGSSDDIIKVIPYLRDSNPVMANLAIEVILALTEPNQRQERYQALCHVPALLTSDMLEQRVNDFCLAASQHKHVPAERHINALLKQAYLQSWFDLALKQTLINLLPAIPFVPGVFKGLRYLLKMSEFRLDTDIQPLINFLLETSAPHFIRSWDYYYSAQGRLNVAKELASDNARLAISQRTHRYFSARFSRVLKQLGVASSPHFTAMAEKTLLHYSDNNAKEPRCSHSYHYNQQSKCYTSNKHHYDSYAHCTALNTLLHSNAPNYSHNSRGIWLYDPDKTFTGRGEAFPHLWDKAPESLLNIALNTDCLPVANFSLRALRDNTAFCQALSFDTLITLLLKPFESSQQFALQQLHSRRSDTPLPDHIISQLFLSPSDDIIQFALTELDKIRDFNRSRSLLVSLLCINNSALRAWLNSPLNSTKFTFINQDQLLEETLNACVNPDTNANHGLSVKTDLYDHNEWLFNWLMNQCKNAIKRLDIKSVEPLILSPSYSTSLLGCKLLDAMPVSYTYISESTLNAIHHSSSKAVQAFSIALLKKLTPEQLAEKTDYLIELLPKCGEAKRAAIISVIATAISTHKPSRSDIFNRLIHQLHKRELEQPLQQGLIQLLQKHFNAALNTNKADGLWLLACARSQMAQSLAAEYLGQHIDDTDASSRAEPSLLTADQWFPLLSSPTLSLRKLARTYFSHQPDTLLMRMDAILQVLESPWPDTQRYGFAFCREHMTKDIWQPDQIIAICDSVVEPVQQYGRELIQTYFDESDGRQYLIQLSQHPSANVELFVSQLLPQYAAGDTNVILALHPYFLSVLSRVNTGRIAKDCVMEFINEHADTSPQTLEMTCALLTRLSLTSVQKDKSAYLKLMLDLSKRHHDKDLDLPIQITPIPTQIATTVPRRIEE